MPIGLISHVVRDDLPFFLSKVPIPRTFRGFNKLTYKEWGHLLSFTAFCGSLIYFGGYPIYLYYFPQRGKKAIDPNIEDMSCDGGLDIFDVEDLGSHTKFCRCWKSESSCKGTCQSDRRRHQHGESSVNISQSSTVCDEPRPESRCPERPERGKKTRQCKSGGGRRGVDQFTLLEDASSHGCHGWMRDVKSKRRGIIKSKECGGEVGSRTKRNAYKSPPPPSRSAAPSKTKRLVKTRKTPRLFTRLEETCTSDYSSLDLHRRPPRPHRARAASAPRTTLKQTETKSNLPEELTASCRVRSESSNIVPTAPGKDVKREIEQVLIDHKDQLKTAEPNSESEVSVLEPLPLNSFNLLSFDDFRRSKASQPAPRNRKQTRHLHHQASEEDSSALDLKHMIDDVSASYKARSPPKPRDNHVTSDNVSITTSGTLTFSDDSDEEESTTAVEKSETRPPMLPDASEDDDDDDWEDIIPDIASNPYASAGGSRRRRFTSGGRPRRRSTRRKPPANEAFNFMETYSLLPSAYLDHLDIPPPRTYDRLSRRQFVRDLISFDPLLTSPHLHPGTSFHFLPTSFYWSDDDDVANWPYPPPAVDSNHLHLSRTSSLDSQPMLKSISDPTIARRHLHHFARDPPAAAPARSKSETDLC